MSSNMRFTSLLQKRWVSTGWTPATMTVNEFAPMAFFALDRPLLALHNQVDHHQWTLPSSTTTITLDISRTDGQLKMASSEGLEQDQVTDYLVAMQQRWEQEQKKRSLAKKQSFMKKGFFEKN